MTHIQNIELVVSCQSGFKFCISEFIINDKNIQQKALIMINFPLKWEKFIVKCMDIFHLSVETEAF